MECKYCKNQEKGCDKWRAGDIIFVAPAAYTFVGDGKQYPIPMRYCPACGRPLLKKGR